MTVAEQSDSRTIESLGHRLIREYEQMEAAFFAAEGNRDEYARLSGQLDKLQRLFDEFALLLREFPDPPREVLEVKRRVAACYRGYTSLSVACKEVGTEQEEERDFSWEEEQEEEFADDEPQENIQDDIQDDEILEEEGKADRSKKRKSPTSRTEQQRQESRRMAASAIYGYQPNPEQQYSESDIQTAELRRREELRHRERQEAENRRIRQESMDAYRRSQQQARAFERPTGHIDMSFRAKQDAREPESPAHQESHPSKDKPETESSGGKREDAFQKTRQEVVAAFGFSVTAVQAMSSSELRFWQNRLRYASGGADRGNDAPAHDTCGTEQRKGSQGTAKTTGDQQRQSAVGGSENRYRPPAARASEAEKRWYERRAAAAAELGIPLEKVLEMTDHELQEARSGKTYSRQTDYGGAHFHRQTSGGHSSSTRDTDDPKTDRENSQRKNWGKEPGRGSVFTLRQVTDVLLIAGIKAGEVTFELGKSAVYYGTQKMLHDASTENDAFAGISAGSIYLGTAGGLAQAAAHHNPAAPLRHSASRLIGENFPDRLQHEYAKQQFGRFKREKALDGKMAEMLRDEKGKVPHSPKALREKAQQVEKTIRDDLAKKVGSSNLQRSRQSLKGEISSLKKQGMAMKERLKSLESRRGLSPAERQEIIVLRKKLKALGARTGKMVSAVRAKEDMSYVSQRLQMVTKRAVQNKQAKSNATRLARDFLLRPLVAGRESNTEGLYYGYRIASHPVTRWVAKRPLWLARKAAPVTTQRVENAVHAVAAAPKKAATHAASGIKRGVSNLMPKGLKTGIQRVKSTYAVAKTGIQNRVFRASAWVADTWLGHATTAARMAGRWVSNAVRASVAFLGRVGVWVLGAMGIFLLVCVGASAFFTNIMAGSSGGIIMSPAESTSGKINLGPYCMVYSSESKRFDEKIVSLIRKYSDKEIYDSVETSYSGASSNAREILSMMAVRLKQNLDIDHNPDVKNYISYMFRQSHVYSVYENEYYCEGCEQRPTGKIIQKVVIVNGAPTIIEVPEMEDFCPGHIDVKISVEVYNDFDELFDLDHYPSGPDWEGWTEDNAAWCKTIYEMDWNELYEGLEYLSSGAISGVPASEYEQKIWNFLMELIGNEYGAAGLMGNLYCESGLDPTNLQDTYEGVLGYNNATYTAAVDSGSYSEDSFVHDSAGYGLAQWTWHTRKQNLYRYCTSRGLSIGSIDGQLGYLGTELTGSFSKCLANLQGASSVEEASRIAMLQFEAPQDQSAAAQAVRQQYAEYFYNKMVFGVSSEGDLTQKQQEVIHIAMNSGSYGIAARPGYCQAWAAHVYGAAGLPIDTSASAYDSGMRYGVSSDFSSVPPGAAVYGYSGSKYGHVGIYVGNGQVYHNIGGVAVDTLSDWIRKYKGFCWGWEGGSDLTTYD